MKINSRDFRVRPGETVKLRKWPTKMKPFCMSKKRYKILLKEHIKALNSRQRLHYASSRYALLLIFQGMDAAGKDGVIRHVMSGINPKGCQVKSGMIIRTPAAWADFPFSPIRAIHSVGLNQTVYFLTFKNVFLTSASFH